MDHHRPVELLRQRRLVGPAEVAAPLESAAPCSCSVFDRVVVGDPRKRLLDRFELRSVAFEHLQLAPPLVEHAADDRDDQVFGQVHHVVEVGVGHLGLDHPELGEVAARLRFLGAERRAEAVDAAERHGVGFVVELAALRQVRRLSSKYCAGNSVVVPSQAAGVKIGVSARMKPRVVEEVADGVDDLVADAQDRLLPLAADPEVAAVEQVVDAVLLGRDRIVVRRRRRPRAA